MSWRGWNEGLEGFGKECTPWGRSGALNGVGDCLTLRWSDG